MAAGDYAAADISRQTLRERRRKTDFGSPIGRSLVEQPGVSEVHDLHVWEVTSGFPSLSAHVLVGAERDCHEARRQMEAMLHERFGLDHTTLQVDHAGDALLEIAPPAEASRRR